MPYTLPALSFQMVDVALWCIITYFMTGFYLGAG